mmetsp:Transcript_30015/g.60294  ORF Transcript_30015/g.60294 Transcript_30015/m.60294 type:complete len:153 (-) Transcript_30015:28-486(-)
MMARYSGTTLSREDKITSLDSGCTVSFGLYDFELEKQILGLILPPRLLRLSSDEVVSVNMMPSLSSGRTVSVFPKRQADGFIRFSSKRRAMIPSFYYLRVVHEIALICDMYKIRELQYQSNYQLNTNATYELSRDVGRGSTKSTKRSVCTNH